MSFDGDLQHLPIVDVIQLLHATGKSGTLTLRSLKGESQLVFHDGYIVSANHVNNSVRIGQILLDMGVISHEELETALHEQQKAGARRKPIIQTLIEGGRLHPDQAYQGLEVLIEMTIVEILTWTRGTFSLDVEIISVSDEYRYFPEQLKKEIQLNTQSVLMDALRIYDEKKRDGTLDDGSVFGPGPVMPSEAPTPETSAAEISAADLGLDELDNLESKIPEAFTGLDLEPDTPAKRLQLVLTGIPPEEQQRLFRFLASLTERPTPAAADSGVILLSSDKLVREWVAAVSGERFLCATSDPAAVDPIIDQFHSKGRTPLLLVDGGEPNGKSASDTIALLQQKRQIYPDLALIVLTAPGDFDLTTRALQAGVRAVLPRSSRVERRDSFIADTIDCAKALEGYLGSSSVGSVGSVSSISGVSDESSAQPEQGVLRQLKEQLSSISEKREPSEVTYTLLQAVASFFERAVTLIAVRSELVAERGIGISGAGETSSLRLRIPVGGASLFQKALDGESYFGESDATVRQTLGDVVGAPAENKILLLPVKSFGRAIAVIYADFGGGAARDARMELLEILAQHAGLVIDNALYRKRCAQKPG